MGDTTKIQWTDHTFNPWSGCTKVAEGCKFCYAEVNYSVKMRGVKWGPNGNRVLASESMWKQPLKWNRQAEKEGVRKRVFCASLADVFEDWPGLIHNHKGQKLIHVSNSSGEHLESENSETRPLGLARDATLDDIRRDLFALIDATPWLDWQLLTKRPENIIDMWPEVILDRRRKLTMDRSNVWLGTSIATQADADKNIPELLKCRDLVPVLFVSAEPLIGPIDLEMIRDPNRFPGCAYFDVLRGRMIHEDDGNQWTKEFANLNWVIIGGESGTHARPCDLAWIRSLVQQGQSAGVATFVKQLGAKPFDSSNRISITAEGSHAVALPIKDPKGGDWLEWPDDFRVQQFPESSPVGRPAAVD